MDFAAVQNGLFTKQTYTADSQLPAPRRSTLPRVARDWMLVQANIEADAGVSYDNVLAH